MSAFLRTTTTAARAATGLSARAFSSSVPRPVARITIVGNLADTPELRASSTGREYLRYSVASNTGSGENRKTSWFNVSCFTEDGPRRNFFQSLPKGCVFLVFLLLCIYRLLCVCLIIECAGLIVRFCSTLVMVEADATMSNYVDSEGKPRQGLNITQRKLPPRID